MGGKEKNNYAKTFKTNAPKLRMFLSQSSRLWRLTSGHNFVPGGVLSPSARTGLLPSWWNEGHNPKMWTGWPLPFLISLKTLLQRPHFLLLCLTYFPFIFPTSMTSVFLFFLIIPIRDHQQFFLLSKRCKNSMWEGLKIGKLPSSKLSKRLSLLVAGTINIFYPKAVSMFLPAGERMPRIHPISWKICDSEKFYEVFG